MWTCRWTGGRQGCPGWAFRRTSNSTSPPWPSCAGTTRYDRETDGVERVTGVSPQSIEAFVAAHRDLYLG
jgi:hypothetical protein